MKTKEEIETTLNSLFLKLGKYPFSEPIAEAIDRNLELLRELEEEGE